MQTVISALEQVKVSMEKKDESLAERHNYFAEAEKQPVDGVIEIDTDEHTDAKKFKKISLELLDMGLYYTQKNIVPTVKSDILYQIIDAQIDIDNSFNIVLNKGHELYTQLDQKFKPLVQNVFFLYNGVTNQITSYINVITTKQDDIHKYVEKNYTNAKVQVQGQWMRLDFVKDGQVSPEDLKTSMVGLYDFLKNFDVIETTSQIKSKLYTDAISCMQRELDEQNKAKNKKPHQIVIIGASFGGRMLAQQLLSLDSKTIQITFVDKANHFEFICTNYKSLCDPNSFEYLSLDQQKTIPNLEKSKHPIKFVHGSLEKINHEIQSIDVKQASGEQTQIEYDALAVCTGAQYNSPWRDGNATTISTYAGRLAENEKVRKEISKAKRILIVGGGATGVESAGYIAEKFPDKAVGICQRGTSLISSISGAHAKVLPYLKELGINVHLGTSYDEATKEKLNYDYVLDCRGYKFLSPKVFMQGELAKCIEPRTGQIQVNKFCQVTNQHPIAEVKMIEQTYPNIFSFGDVCLSPANEGKDIVSMYQYRAQVSHNILAVLNKKTNLQAIPKEFSRIQCIPIGTKKGIFAINNMVMLTAQAPVQKDEIETQYLGEMRNEPAALRFRYFQAKLMSCLVWILGSIFCCCFPCGNRSTRAQRQKLREEIKESVENLLQK